MMTHCATPYPNTVSVNLPLGYMWKIGGKNNSGHESLLNDFTRRIFSSESETILRNIFIIYRKGGITFFEIGLEKMYIFLKILLRKWKKVTVY